jgi:hypothetical protein
MIANAASGAPEDCQEFVRRFAGPVAEYLRHHDGQNAGAERLASVLDRLLVRCARSVTEPLAPSRFRAFLFASLQSALEEEEGAAAASLTPADSIFARAFAAATMYEAAEHHRALAKDSGLDACRRLEMLGARYGENLPAEEIADRWGLDAEALDAELARAGQEFREALHEVMEFYHPGQPDHAEREAAELIRVLDRR